MSMLPGRASKWIPALLEVVRAHPAKRGSRHAAMLLKGNRAIMARNNNNRSAKWLHQRGYWSMHAEAAVLNNVPRDIIKGATLVVIRMAKDGRLVNSKPCEDCQRLIEWADVRRVVYSNDQGEWERL